MIDVGPLLPERGRFRAFVREINRLKEAIIALRPMPGVGSQIKATRIGTAREGKPTPPPVFGEQKGGEAVWL